MAKKTYEFGVHEEVGTSYPFVVAIRVIPSTPGVDPSNREYWKGKKEFRKWVAKNAESYREALTPSMKFTNRAGDPLWVIRFRTLPLATKFYLVYGEGM